MNLSLLVIFFIVISVISFVDAAKQKLKDSLATDSSDGISENIKTDKKKTIHTNCASIPSDLDCVIVSDEKSGFNNIRCSSPSYIPIEKEFAVVFDAGSTSTRVHVYEFYVCNGEAFGLVADHFFPVNHPLSSFVNRLDKISTDIIDPLMQNCMRVINNSLLKKDIPIVFYATAGLRKLENGADLLLSAVRDALSVYTKDAKYKAYRFKFFKNPETAVSILSGKDEGIYAWITANFMMNRIGPNCVSYSKTVGIMDLGGASVQLVFEVDQEKELLYFKNSAKNSNFSTDHPYTELTYNKKRYVLFQRSVMMGLMEARRIAKEKTVEKNAKNYLERMNSLNGNVHEYDGALLHHRFGCYNWNTSEEVIINNSSIAECSELGEILPNGPPVPVNMIIGALEPSYGTCKDHVMDIFNTVLNSSKSSNEFEHKPFLYSEFFPGIPTESSDGYFVANSLKQDFFVFSFFADRLKQIFPDHSLECKVGTFSILTMACNSTLCDEFIGKDKERCFETLGKNQDFCLDSVFLHSLLRDGCGLNDDVPLYVAHSIENVGICWALGAAMIMIDSNQ